MKKLIGLGAAVAGVGAVFAAALPEIRRYLKVRGM